MSDLSWWKEGDTAKVYAYLAAQLKAIFKRPPHERRKFISHEIYCSGCDSPIVQVVSLKYPDDTDCVVIRSCDPKILPLNLPDPCGLAPGEHGRLAANAVARRPKSYRPGEWRFQIVADDDLDRRSSVFSACNCGNHTFTVSGILARSGRKSTTRRPGT